MNERILEVTETLARKAMNLKNTYVSSKFSVSGKTVDITMSNGLIIAKITFPRQLIDETLECVDMGHDVVSVISQFMPETLPEDTTAPEEIEVEEIEEDMAEKDTNKPVKKSLKKRG